MEGMTMGAGGGTSGASKHPGEGIREGSGCAPE